MQLMQYDFKRRLNCFLPTFAWATIRLQLTEARREIPRALCQSPLQQGEIRKQHLLLRKVSLDKSKTEIVLFQSS